MDFKSLVQSELNLSFEAKKKLASDEALAAQIAKVCEVIVSAYREGKKTLIAGNGGSAADAQHIAAEFVSRFYFDRPALPSIALTTDTSILTAIGNDYSYERLFSRQIEAMGQKGDVFIAISTSGNSKNILMGLEAAKSKGLITVGLTGASGGKMAALCDYAIKAPSDSTPRIQECHILVGHIICGAVEANLFTRPQTGLGSSPSL